ncbi:MAG: hypothetical protein HUN04_08325 [Desulfobacter sp.]|nr:MAG: hypothetical protein HUN04_08325 [Desulfobacter sp.]
MDKFWTDKKIVAYIALPHHTRFIIPVMERLAALGAKTKYIVGQAERSQEMTAINLGLPYSHVFDYINPEDRKEISDNYTRLAATFSGSLKQEFLLGTLPVTVADKTLMATAMEYVGFKNIIEQEKPDICFALHELNRWGKLFAFWAKKANIPFIALQEGLSYDLDFGYSGHAQYATLNLVWGQRVKKKMTGFEAPGSKMIVTGNTHLAREIQRQKEEGRREKIRRAYKAQKDFLCLLILSAVLPPPEQFAPLVKAVEKAKGLKLFVKFHPACKRHEMDGWIDCLLQGKSPHIRFIHEEENTYDLISAADVVVLGQKSTTGLEALSLGKPLVKLDTAYDPKGPYSFVDQGVAAKMSAKELARHLEKGIDFNDLTDRNKVAAYLENELADTSTAIERVCRVFETAIRANRTRETPITIPALEKTKDWTFVVEVPENREDIFLAQLEAIAVNSEKGPSYETFFLVPEKISQSVRRVLDSLEGDMTKIPAAGKSPEQIRHLNKVLEGAKGKKLAFLDRGMAPLSGWLARLEEAAARYGKDWIFGTRIADNKGKIAHTGMVVDRNNTPVPAYRHLDIDFEHGKKERPFQMVDYFMAVDKEIFFRTGGFSPGAGPYIIPDFCLKFRDICGRPDPAVYLPGVKMIYLEAPCEKTDPEAAIYFYSKWHGALWESRSGLWEADGVSEKDLAHAGISAAMTGLR